MLKRRVRYQKLETVYVSRRNAKLLVRSTKMVLMLCRLKAQVRPLPPFTEGWSILSRLFLINASRSFPASDDPILAKFSNCYWKFNPASIMPSFLRISGSNYSYMLNISLLTKLWKQKYKDKISCLSFGEQCKRCLFTNVT